MTKAPSEMRNIRVGTEKRRAVLAAYVMGKEPEEIADEVSIRQWRVEEILRQKEQLKGEALDAVLSVVAGWREATNELRQRIPEMSVEQLREFSDQALSQMERVQQLTPDVSQAAAATVIEDAE